MKKKTFRGKWIDMDALTRQNENTLAAGNMGVNAKGDRIGPGGAVIETSGERTRKHYSSISKTVNKTSLKEKEKEPSEVFQDEKKKSPTKRKTKKVERETDTGDIIMEDAKDDTTSEHDND